MCYVYTCIKANKYSPARRPNTINQNEIRSSFHRLTMCKHAVVSYTDPHSWNRLPEAIKQNKNHWNFQEKNLRSILLVNMSNL